MEREERQRRLDGGELPDFLPVSSSHLINSSPQSPFKSIDQTTPIDLTGAVVLPCPSSLLCWVWE